MANEQNLSEKENNLLNVLIQHHIELGQPIASKALSQVPSVDASPATVRNIMAKLEDVGYIESPHTSAGRVPTAAGYRFFIDTLLHSKPIQQEIPVAELNELSHSFNQSKDTTALISSASDLLSKFSKMAAVVTLPGQGYSSLRHIEFVKLSSRQVLSIIVINEDEIINKIIDTEQEIPAHTLQEAANYINDTFNHCSLDHICQALVEELGRLRSNLNQAMMATIELAASALNPEKPQEDFILSGKTQLMNFQDFGDMQAMQELFNAFDQKVSVLKILNQVAESDGVQIFLGAESGYQAITNCSLVTAPYNLDTEHPLGVLGVIGPTRMNYDRVIPLVDVTAKLIGAALKLNK